MGSGARRRNVKTDGRTSNVSGNAARGKKKDNNPWHTWKLGLLLLGVISAGVVIFIVFRDHSTEQYKSNEVPKKKGKVPSDKSKSSRTSRLISEDLVNTYDSNILKELEQANRKLKSSDSEKALQVFHALLQKYPDSPLALYGKGQALEKKADELRSNDILLQSIQTYEKVGAAKECPRALLKAAYMRMAEKLEFLGRLKQALKVVEKLSTLVSDDADVLNKLGVHHLLIGSNEGAEKAFRKVLQINSGSGFAKSHLGFVLKSKLLFEESVPLLEEGIRSGEEGADHARFFFHLGDAYSRLGKPGEAWRVYEDGAKKGIFMSPWQRSLYNADTSIKAQPWWSPEESGHLKDIRKLEANWKTIRDEGLAILDARTGGFIPEEENLREKGDWLQFTLYQQGRRNYANCKKTPKTCSLLETMTEATGCKRGQIKYSVMHPGTHVWPHCGPTNCRLRAHLGLVIPKGVAIRCGAEERVWKEGKVIIIDDSFDHEVWHNGTSFRLIFIIDFWHPELTPKQKSELSPI